MIDEHVFLFKAGDVFKWFVQLGHQPNDQNITFISF